MSDSNANAPTREDDAAESAVASSPVAFAFITGEQSDLVVAIVTPLSAALAVLQDRQLRRTNPAGYFKGKRWYPDASELRLIPNNVRTPTLEHPYTMLRYCRTAQHVANLFRVDVRDLKEAARVGK